MTYLTGGVNDSVGFQVVDNQFFLNQLKLLGMLNVKYIVSDRMLKSDTLALVFSEGDWNIYDNPYVQKRFQLIPSHEVMRDRNEILQAMRGDAFKPEILVLLEDEIKEYAGSEDLSIINDDIQVLEEHPDRIVLTVSSKKDQVLFIPNVYYPGWSVQVDGVPAQILRANYVLSSVPVKRGKHEVVLSYSPLTVLSNEG